MRALLRTRWVGFTVMIGVVFLICCAVAGLRAQAPPQAAPAQPARQGGGGRGGPAQGGTGPIRVMFVTKGHPYDREGLAVMLDGLGKDISWSHVEHPAATTFFDQPFSVDSKR